MTKIDYASLASARVRTILVTVECKGDSEWRDPREFAREATDLVAYGH